MDLLREIRSSYPKIKVLILTMYVNSSTVTEAIKLGAKGFIPKNASLEEFKKGIYHLSKDESYFSPIVTEVMAKSIANNDDSSTDLLDKIQKLSNREKEILSMVIAGDSNQEIADKFFISRRTVENHRAHILKKTRSKIFLELSKIVIENYLLT
jgi:DNA-binding NarL/FixJ family response regulator